MEILCSREDFLTGVNTVQRAVPTKNTLPILQGIKLKASDNKLWFEATDLELSIRCYLPVTIHGEGEVVLPAKLFSEIVRKLPDSDLKIVSNDHNVNIYYNNSNFAVNGFDPEEFPEIAEITSEDPIVLPSALFKDMIKQTIFACAVDESRPVFTGLLLHIDKENILLIATDTHRLAFTSSVIPGNEKEFKGIIPAKTMNEIYRLLDDEEVLTIKYNKSRVIFEFGSVQILTRLIEGQFPNYKQVIPQSCNTKILVDGKKFLDTVERASLLSRDNYLKTNTVRFSVENSAIIINQHSEMGKISEQIEIEQEGEDFTISFNAKYITDVLKVINTEQVIMEASGSYSPVVFRPVSDDSYLYLALPLRN